jgi:hypothetical protein
MQAQNRGTVKENVDNLISERLEKHKKVRNKSKINK